MNQNQNELDLSAALLRHAQMLPRDRVVPLCHEGKRYWVKFREERKTFRHRILKGNALAALAREKDLLSAFAKRDVPVPRIVAHSSECVILTDHGPDLTEVLKETSRADAILRRVGETLAEMHAAGVAHGRPCIRDICWDNNTVTFLDLEAGARLDAGPRRQARDLLLLVHSLFSSKPVYHKHAPAILEGYIANDTKSVWPVAVKIARRSYLLELLAKPIIWRQRQRGKTSSEFYAIPTTRRFIRTYDSKVPT